MRLLQPSGDDEVDLDLLYAHPAGVVRANMVSSLDGAVRDDSGVSDGLSGPADKRVFGTLRAACDVVLVGAGTVRSEGYGPAKVNQARRAARVARGQREVPPLAVVTSDLDLDLSSPLFSAAEVPPILLTTEQATAARRHAAGEVADVVVAGAERVDLRAALAALRERGLLRVLCEGGPSLLTELAAGGLLDELCLTVSLRVVGGDSGRLTTGAAVQGWNGELVHVLSADDLVFLRVVRPAPPTR